ncbi:MAG: LacI family DNA-binding transcriptional regulator [Devosia sp.]
MVGIQDVAERAGVSLTTVSHAIHHAERVSEPLRQRVEAAIAELGYRPNPQAQSLRTGRTNVVATLIPDVLNPYFTDLVKTVQTELGRSGLDALIFNTDVPGGHAEQHGREYLRQISAKRVDGLIVGDVALNGMHEHFFELDIPAVFVGHLSNGAIDSVRADSFQGAHLMGEYLASTGHRRIAHVTGPSFFTEAAIRRAGFEAGLAGRGIEMADDLRFEGSFLEPSGREAVEWLLSRHGGEMPSAIFFANYLMALGALSEFYDRGIQIPRDIAVCIFEDLPQLEYVRPRLTRVGLRPAVLAERATQMLLDRLGNSYSGPPRAEVIPCALQVFDSA